MVDIQTALNQILASVYGKDVRNAIYDSIYQINDNANEAINLATIKFGNAVTSPTSPTQGFIENTVYLNSTTGIMWRLEGGSWSEKAHFRGIASFIKTGVDPTDASIDIYTVTFNDGTTETVPIKNGKDGKGIADVVSQGTTPTGEETYKFELSDGTLTPNGFTVKNGKSVKGVEQDGSAIGNTRNYKIKLSDDTYAQGGFSVSDGQSSFLYIRYSANFDGQGMVSTPSASTPYIGICSTTQNTAPTDPSVYSWVKFIGESGSGSGDMLKSEYASSTPGVVAKAAALFDTTASKEVDATDLMSRSVYASEGILGTVDKALKLVDSVNSKEADTPTLAKFSTSADGKLNWDGNPIAAEIKVDDALSDTSKNPVQNKIITGEINKLNTAISKKSEEVTLDKNNWTGSVAPFEYDLSAYTESNKYDLEILPTNTWDSALQSMVVKAQIGSSGNDNKLYAWGNKPTDNIPVIIRKEYKTYGN